MKEISLAGRLSELMRAKRLTLRAVAKKTGVSSAAVSKWRTGDAEPQASNVAALARALGVSADHLLGIDEDLVALAAAERSRKAAELDDRVSQLINEVREFKAAESSSRAATSALYSAEPKK